ncbi:BTAD domain-containing putative transcriptional regulator [Pseudofrankia sp. BMG5.37]|uniref:ATP-binding protein n=1 Tax=Pseudofrankia sp. BMG5.37 TaxID=3050035 RepID=UPI00289580A3|nr:BTAD domain-containing putative transcriptional regulator [Pseudofrankia sp. BMG5.37]MDT3445204.1 BTAD domain-containing putative transcriptional regulator [Pseudofrankia sp. BMG5.37]
MRGVPLYRLFGPVEVVREGRPVALGGPKPRAVLAALLLDAGRVVSVDRLADAVWGDEHPPSMLSSLHAHISNLRRLLRDDERATSPIVRRNPGYVADVAADEIDLRLFERECDRARAAADAGDWPATVEAAERAAALRRRGPLLAEFADEPWVLSASASFDERWAQCEQHAVMGLLGVGRVTAAVSRSRELLVATPLTERACWLRMVTLYRAGRAAEALDVFREHARRMDEELGLDVGPALRQLQGAILRQDGTLDAWPAALASAGPATGGLAVAGATAAAATTAAGTSSNAATRGSSAGRAQPAPVDDDLVGRGREVAALESVLAEAVAGAGRWVVLTGPAGIGKSRLAEEAAGSWQRAGGVVSRTGCPDDVVPPWWPLRQLLRDLGADPDDLLTPPAGVDADAARFVVYDRVAGALADAAAARPLMVVAEDVHWADPASLRLLTHLAGAAAFPGLAVVATARDVSGNPELDRLLAAVSRRHGSRRLAVPPLTEAEVTELAGRVSGQAIDAAEAAELADRTGGNPFFVCEYARLPAEERASGQVPVAVRSVLGQRLAGLDLAVTQVLRAAAVIGDTLDIDLLGRVTRLDRDELADLLDEAADEHVIVQAAGTGRYMFAHALLRDEVVAGISGLRRQRLHLRVAEALGPTGGGEALPRRAAHLVAAWPLADAADVFDACRAAALDAERRWYSEAAAHWWGQALDALDQTTGDPGVDRDEVVVARVTALARAGRGQTLLDVVDAGLLDAVRRGRLDSAGRLAAALLRTSGSWPWAVYGDDPAPLLARLAGLETLVTADPVARVRVLAALAVGSCYDPDGSVPDLLSRRAIDLAERTGDDEALADALLGRALAFSGIAERATESLGLLARLAAVPHASAQIDEVITHGLRYLAKTALGDPTAADHVRLGALGSDLLRLPASRVQFRWAQGSLALWRDDDLTAAEATYRHAFELHRETELYQSGVYQVAMLSLRFEQGQLGEPAETPPISMSAPWTATLTAIARGGPGTDELIAAEIARFEPVTWATHGRLAVLAHAVADRGLREHVETLTARLAPVAHCVANIGQCGMVGPVALGLARLAALADDLPAARAHLGSATELAIRTQGAGALLRCRLFAAQLAARTGEPVDDAELRDVAERAARRGMTGVARDAQALVTQLTAAP